MAAQQDLANYQTTVTVELDDILTRKRSRAGKVQQQAAIHRLACFVTELAKMGLPRLGRYAGQPLPYRVGLRPGQANNRDGTASRRCRECCDRVIGSVFHGPLPRSYRLAVCTSLV